MQTYPLRSTAIRAARHKGWRAWHTYKPNAYVNQWVLEERQFGPGIEYAQLFAADKDWIYATEIDDKMIPILVVTCFREEIIEKIPDLFRIEPLTPELWENNRKLHPPPADYKPKPIINHGVSPPMIWEGQAAPAPVAPNNNITSATGQAPIKRERAGGAKAICREVYLAMPGATKKDVIAACVERGVLIGTAAARYTDIKREFDGT